jgi:hypothetical protein
MLRYKLRTLLIFMAVVPPLLAGGWWLWQVSPILVVWMVAMAFLASLPPLIVASIVKSDRRN